MGASIMIFKEGGVEWRPVTLKPPKKIPCPCGKTMMRGAALLMDPLIWEFRCPDCNRRAEIQETDTNEHWPIEVQAAYEDVMRDWHKQGCPIRFEEPVLIMNKGGITKIDLEADRT